MCDRGYEDGERDHRAPSRQGRRAGRQGGRFDLERRHDRGNQVRRASLVLAALGCAAALTACGSSKNDSVTTAAPDPEASTESNWSYTGDTGPAHWGSLSPD